MLLIPLNHITGLEVLVLVVDELGGEMVLDHLQVGVPTGRVVECRTALFALAGLSLLLNRRAGTGVSLELLGADFRRSSPQLDQLVPVTRQVGRGTDHAIGHAMGSMPLTAPCSNHTIKPLGRSRAQRHEEAAN